MARFDGDVYDPRKDDVRLTAQLGRVLEAMTNAAHARHYITVNEIHELTGDPAPSVLAQIGHLRKKKHGQYLIWRQRRHGSLSATWEYLLGPKGAGIPRRHRCKRIALLEEALAACNPDHPLLIDAEDW